MTILNRISKLRIDKFIRNEIEDWMGNKINAIKCICVTIKFNVVKKTLNWIFQTTIQRRIEQIIMKWYRDILMKRSIKSRKSNCTWAFIEFVRCGSAQSLNQETKKVWPFIKSTIQNECPIFQCTVSRNNESSRKSLRAISQNH